MRAAFISAPRELRIDEVDVPTAAPDGVVVDVLSCSICATDAHNFAHGGSVIHPSIFGHEWIARVVEVGDQVTDLHEGQTVVVTVGPPCGSCHACRRGLGDHCEAVILQARGRDAGAPAWGGFSDRISVKATRVIGIPDEMPREARELLEPAAVAFRGVRHAKVELGDLVVVQGGGAIGQFAAQWARLAGAGRVVVIEPEHPRRELALALGAHEAIHPEEAPERLRDLSGGWGADVVVECTGVAGLVQPGAELVRRGGRYSLLGYPIDRSSISVRDWLGREISVVASMGYSRADTVTTIEFATDGRLRAEGMVNVRIGFDELAQTLGAMEDREITEPRVVFEPQPQRQPRPRLA